MMMLMITQSKDANLLPKMMILISAAAPLAAAAASSGAAADGDGGDDFAAVAAAAAAAASIGSAVPADNDEKVRMYRPFYFFLHRRSIRND